MLFRQLTFLPLISIPCIFRSSLTTCSSTVIQEKPLYFSVFPSTGIWMSQFSLRDLVIRSPSNSYKSLTVVSSDKFPMYNVLNLFRCWIAYLKWWTLLCFLSSKFTLLRLLQLVLRCKLTASFFMEMCNFRAAFS